MGAKLKVTILDSDYNILNKDLNRFSDKNKLWFTLDDYIINVYTEDNISYTPDELVNYILNEMSVCEYVEFITKFYRGIETLKAENPKI